MKKTSWPLWGLLLSAAVAAPALAADCSLEWEATRRDACEKYNDESQWNDSQSNRMIQQYNTRQQLEQQRQERLREQQEEQEAARRREAAKRAAEEEERQRPAREEAATREWLRELDRQDAQRAADKRAGEIRIRKLSARLERIRQRVEGRLRAETERLRAPGAPALTADDYDRLVTLSIPEWDLMRYWADEGLKRFPVEFAYRHAVVQTIGCAGRTYARQFLGIPGDCPLPSNPPEALMTTRSPFPLEQMMACGYRYLHWRTFELAFVPQGRQEGEYRPGPFRAWSAAELAGAEQEAMRRWKAAHECEAAVGPSGQVLHDTLLARMTRLEGNFKGFYPLLEKPSLWDAYKRWYLVSRTAWGSHPPLQDAAEVNRILDRVEQAYRTHEPEWSFFDGGMNDSPAP